MTTQNTPRAAMQQAPADADEQEEAMAHDALMYELSVALMRLDGNDGDPHQLIWCGGPIPEPWGDAWQKYEEQAESVLNAIGEGSARELVKSVAALRASLSSLAAGEEPPELPPLSDEHRQLMKFYGVITLRALVNAQARHIEKLQAKLPATPSLAPNRVREG